MLLKNIVLIGPSGCGKTTVGTVAAKMCGVPFFDSDDVIEKKADRKISEIFETDGEDFFRKLESSTLLGLSRLKSCVIATGGGCVTREINMKNLRQKGVIVYLSASAEKIYENIKDDDTRPLLRGKTGAEAEKDAKIEKIKDFLEEREPLYERYADITINTDGERSAADAADSIALRLVNLGYIKFW